MYESSCVFSSKTNFVASGVIYLIASYDFFVNTPSPLCYIINQQQLQFAAYVVRS